MKISELVEHLSPFDQDLPVFVDGYEGGYDESRPDLIRAAWLLPNRHFGGDEWYYGPYLEAPAGDSDQRRDSRSGNGLSG